MLGVCNIRSGGRRSAPNHSNGPPENAYRCPSRVDAISARLLDTFAPPTVRSDFNFFWPAPIYVLILAAESPGKTHTLA